MSVQYLSDKQLQDMRAFFEAADADHSGSLEINEVSHVFAMCGVPQKIIPAFFKMCDRDRSGSITFDELYNYLNAYAGLSVNPTIFFKLVFESFDNDNSGFLDVQEFGEALAILGFDYTPEQVRARVAAFDANGDGKVSLQEFLTVAAGK